MRAVTFFSAEPAFEESAPAPDRVRSGTPCFQTDVAYQSPDQRLLAGVWRASPGAWAIRYDETEYCHILSGKGRLIDVDGVARDFGAGDSFVISPGFRGVWEVFELMEKQFFIVLPAQDVLGL